MKIKQTMITFVALIGLGGMFFAPLTASAASCGGVATSIITCNDQKGACSAGEDPFEGTDPKGDATKAAAYKAQHKHDYGMCIDGKAPNGAIEQSGIWGMLLLVINIMTAGVGILAVVGVVYGSILYTSAGDSAEKINKAREVIRNVIIGIVAYALMYAGLNFIIPGGLFTP